MRLFEQGEKSNPPSGEKPRQLVLVYIDESYVHKNASLGYTWYDPEDDVKAAVTMKGGKGERLIMLTAITEEFGILQVGVIQTNHDAAAAARVASPEGIDDPKVTRVKENGTLLLFQAATRSGDYHKNMNGRCFNDTWLTQMILPALKEKDLEAIFVLDNASYHLTPYPGSVIISEWKNKTEAAAFMDDPRSANKEGDVVSIYSVC